MSYALSASLQTAVFQYLKADTELETLISGAVFDTAPTNAAPEIFAAIGAEDVLERSDGTGVSAFHDFQITVQAKESGFLTAKIVAGRICDLLVDAPLALTRGRLVGLSFRKAKARRVAKDDSRRIDLWFRAHVADETQLMEN